MRPNSRLAGVLLGVAMSAMVAIVPLTNVAATAQLTTPHWGVSPYYPTCIEGPCRIVIIADKTGNAQYAPQIQRWALWMNFVRNTYNLNLPAFGYVQLNDPSCAVAEGVISVCRSDSILAEDCPGDPLPIRCTTFEINVGNAHISNVRSVFAEDDLADPDVWTVVCAAMGSAIGMGPSTESDSCLQDNITIGTGQEKYYAIPDWLSLFSLYGHAAGS